MGKAAVITHLAVRFYVHDGWTEEEIKPYLYERGSIMKFDFVQDRMEDAYYLPIGYDLMKMFDDGLISEVKGKERWGETKNLSDLEALKTRALY